MLIGIGGLKSFTGLSEVGFKHVARSQPLRTELRKGAKSAVPLADWALGNLQQWLIGTYHGVSKANSRSTSMNSSFGTTVARTVEGKFLSAFIRATKPASCCAPACCA